LFFNILRCLLVVNNLLIKLKRVNFKKTYIGYQQAIIYIISFFKI